MKAVTPELLNQLIEGVEGLVSNSVMLVVNLQNEEHNAKLVVGEERPWWDPLASDPDGKPLASHHLEIYHPRHMTGYAAWHELKALILKLGLGVPDTETP